MGTAAYTKEVRISIDDGTTWLEVPATSPSLELAGEVLDDTTLANQEGWRSRVLGLHDWSVSCDSNYDSDNAALTAIRQAKINRGIVGETYDMKVQYLPVGSANANDIAKGFEGYVVVENFNLTGDVGGLETVSITLQANGALATAA